MVVYCTDPSAFFYKNEWDAAGYSFYLPKNYSKLDYFDAVGFYYIGILIVWIGPIYLLFCWSNAGFSLLVITKFFYGSFLYLNISNLLVNVFYLLNSKLPEFAGFY